MLIINTRLLAYAMLLFDYVLFLMYFGHIFLSSLLSLHKGLFQHEEQRLVISSSPHYTGRQGSCSHG
jgi:uncharacterized membrane protein YqhA